MRWQSALSSRASPQFSAAASPETPKRWLQPRQQGEETHWATTSTTDFWELKAKQPPHPPSSTPSNCLTWSGLRDIYGPAFWESPPQVQQAGGRAAWARCSRIAHRAVCQLAGPCYGPPRVSPEDRHEPTAWSSTWIGHALPPPNHFFSPTRNIYIFNIFLAIQQKETNQVAVAFFVIFPPAKHNYPTNKIHCTDSVLCQEATTNPSFSPGCDQSLSCDEPRQTHSRSATADLGLWAEMSCKVFEIRTRSSTGKLGGFSVIVMHTVLKRQKNMNTNVFWSWTKHKCALQKWVLQESK